MDKEVFLVEELENRLAIEGSHYKHRIDENWQEEKFDAEYFSNFITGSLYTEFVQAIYDRIKPLNSHEANRFLTLSVAQFKSHTPEKREKDFVLNYWHTYWFPNVMDDDVSDYDQKYALHIWKNYTRHFQLFKEATEKALEDFKAGLLGSPSMTFKENGTPIKTINYESFNHYIKHLKYNYPYKTSVFDFKYSMRDYLDFLKTEILDNIIILDKDNRKAYLNKIKYELVNLKQHAWATHETIEVWLKKYDIETDEDIRSGKQHQEIYQILTSEPPTMDEEFDESFNRDTHKIQHDFYNYYYGFYIDAAAAFIDEQIKEHSPAQLQPHQGNPEQKALQMQSTKLKTGLSVPQLALLFKMLNELRPEIFNIKSEAELHRFLSANFETKMSKEEGISTDKLRILFNQPDPKAAEFWEKHFYTLIAEIKKFK